MVAAASSSARIGCYVLGAKVQSTKTFEAWQSQYAGAGQEAQGNDEFIVKRLLPELAENPRLVAQYAQRGERARRLRHDGIARVVDVFVNAENCCVVCEPLQGYPLRAVLDRLHQCANALPVWCAVYIACKVTSALMFAHSGGTTRNPLDAVYHQDVSAENVFITVNGEVKLVDFGLSRAALLGIEVSGTGCWSDSGEFDLWSPNFGDAQSDIQGLGRVLYELLTGTAPTKRWITPSHHAAWISTDLDRILMRMLGTSECYSSIQDVSVALEEHANRQRQSVDSSHLSGLLRVVMLSLPPAAAPSEPPQAEVCRQDSERRSATILPAAVTEPRAPALPLALPDTIERLETVLSKRSAELSESTSNDVSRARRQSSHDWDAAVDSVRRASVLPPASTAHVATTATSEDTAAECFERGLDLLKQGELPSAEAAWLRGLDLDPAHRLCQVNLNLLRKLRDSQRPPTNSSRE